MSHRALPLLPAFLSIMQAGFLLSAASAAPQPVDSPEQAAYFEKHVRPLLIQRCYECHSARTDTAEGGLLLDSKAGWVTGGDSGAAVVPGDLDASLLIRAVRYNDPDLRMPPAGALPRDAVAHLERWVAMGAYDPRVDEHGGTGVSDTAPSDPVAGRTHWAFRPLSPALPPAVNRTEWPRTDVDHFILSGLESAGLQPAGDADPRDVVRRLYLQIVGLPPSPAQVQAFLDDKRPDAVERLVDELLSSAHFGEHWGRHWLDLARFADSNGLDENFLFREAWRYRNWVIDAVNADMPFDRFVLEQVAGDLLPFDTLEQRDRQRIATGFLVVGPKVLLGSAPQQQRMDIADELVDTIGKTFLAQTLGCARCHDHKFDPIPTADYYALAGIMTSTTVVERRFMLGEQRVMERLVGLGPDGDDLDAAYEKYYRELPTLRNYVTQAKAAIDALQKGDTPALQALAKEFPDAVSPDAVNSELAHDQRIAAQQALLDEITQQVANPPPIPPRAMIATDADQPGDESIRIAGVVESKGDQVRRGFLQVVGPHDFAIPDTASGRVELARWLTDADQGAGRLAARVMVNRIWHHVMGRGIVRTVDNFGRTGETPDHPELLDYLATQFLENDWSTRSIVRQIVLSHTNLISSEVNPAAFEIDPENSLLWQFNRRRLSPEALRDSMLAVAGQLELTPMESSVWYLGDQATAVGGNKNRRRTDFPCRSIYLPVIRNDLPEIFDVFDFADPHATTGARPRTTVATQGLFILNSDTVMDAALATAKRLDRELPTGDAAARVERMFELILNSRPAADERQVVLDFIRRAQEDAQSQSQPATGEQPGESTEGAELQAWALACHALFASSRFQFLE